MGKDYYPWNADGNAVEGRCAHCKELRPVLELEDPYAAEILGVVEVSWWCGTCFYESSMDI